MGSIKQGASVSGSGGGISSGEVAEEGPYPEGLLAVVGGEGGEIRRAVAGDVRGGYWGGSFRDAVICGGSQSALPGGGSPSAGSGAAVAGTCGGGQCVASADLRQLYSSGGAIWGWSSGGVGGEVLFSDLVSGRRNVIEEVARVMDRQLEVGGVQEDGHAHCGGDRRDASASPPWQGPSPFTFGDAMARARDLRSTPAPQKVDRGRWLAQALGEFSSTGLGGWANFAGALDLEVVGVPVTGAAPPVVESTSECRAQAGGSNGVAVSKWVGPNRPGSGPCLLDLYDHSYYQVRSRWLWIPIGASPLSVLGFPASSSEVRRFGGSARKVCSVERAVVDSRSYLEAASMEQQGGGAGGVKRPAPVQGRGGYNNNNFNRSFQGRGYGYNNQGGNFRGRGSYGGGGGRYGYNQQGGGQFDGREAGGGVGGQVLELSEAELRARLEKIQMQKEAMKAREMQKQNEKQAPPQEKQQPGDGAEMILGVKEGMLKGECFSCGRVGHLEAMCLVKLEALGLHLCGYGIPGQMFHSIHVELKEGE
ncbi:hypothetical protein ACQ4PT_019049 [Festuca glaucescens]